MLKLVVLFAVVAVACAGNKLMENRKPELKLQIDFVY